MQKITFVTSNKGKVATAHQYLAELNIELKTYMHELIEPQADDIDEIAKSKVIQAYELVNHPCIAQDSGFYVEALNGFPKAYTKFALDTIGIKGILKLMEGVENRACMFKECLAYYDGTSLEYFYSFYEGRLSEKALGTDNPEKWSDLWYLFIPDHSIDGRTLAQLSPDETRERRRSINPSIKQFANWYKNKAM